MGRDLDDLGSRQLTWVQLRDFVLHSPPDSAVVRSVAGEAATWTPDTYLLALVVDLLASANWQRGGKKRGPRPRPVRRPGDRKKYGNTSMSLDEIDKRLGYSPRGQLQK